MSQPTVSRDLRSFYDSAYDGGSEVRRIRAIDRVNAIRALCADRRFDTVLEVGAGEGSVLQRLDETCFAPSLFGLEISATGVEAIKRRGIRSLREAKLFDGYAIPYPDKTFDLAYATQVLEHVEHERHFLTELKRVAKAVFIEVPLEDTLWLARNIRSTAVGHINFYRQETILNLLRTVALEPTRYKLIDYSLATAKFESGPLGGAVKHALRQGFLHAAPWLGQRLFTYYLAALADTAAGA
jgi:ubiquinone/menaquinone biosynthesis C-methylase UbiE